MPNVFVRVPVAFTFLDADVYVFVRMRQREVDPTMRVVAFPLNAAYTELVGHCELEHDQALEALACMSPGAIAEMRQRFQTSQ